MCPHHLFTDYRALLKDCFGENFDHPKYDLPLFPDKRGRPLKREQVVEAFRRCIALTGEDLQRRDGLGALRHRFHEHVPRVVGAQFLARAGNQIVVIELFAR